MSLLPHSRFCTDDLPELDREAAWHEDISIIFDHGRPPVEDRTPFHACFDVYHFGHSALGELRASSGHYVRTKRKIAIDGMDSIMLQLFLEGGVQFGVGQRTTYADAGDIVLFDLAQPVDNINRKFHNISLLWPREAIEATVPNIGRWHGRTLPRENPTVSLLRKHMLASCDLAPRFSQAQGQRIEQATLVLAGAALAESALVPEHLETPTMRDLLTCHIKNHIRKHLGDPNLSPERIALHFGISRRQLYQLLESVGGIARYQMHLRLQRCMADLQSQHNAHLQISEIAYRWGFRNLTTFNRNFRQAFGMTASDVRNCRNQTSTLKGLAANFLVNGQREGLAEHQQWFKSLGA
ncbi:MAG: helix-turn-helix domain-containing protein [Verrucomicrobia bacterium]|nr:helix-turn-helix domain-containing protein [Verrucomicrobiota bacterium]